MKQVETASNSFDAVRDVWNNATSLRNHSRFLKVLHTEAEFRGNLTVSVSYEKKDLPPISTTKKASGQAE
ncbi:hypothetical protein CRE_15954 [Caenorhabditis remanei]|uniref:Uncharacterized protein n=1 Tax=Caenorhabditis remanei TaxID=31234 RepID=E3MBR7_CAERE|nr:hypothetical protein CRE_15954 [Caenorhabditis remanei]